MWRRYSAAEGGILHLPEDARPDMGAEGFGRHQFHAPAEEVFEEKRQAHKVIEGLLPRLEFHENIDVAGLGRLAADERAEQAATPHAQGAELVAAVIQECEEIFFRGHR